MPSPSSGRRRSDERPVGRLADVRGFRHMRAADDTPGIEPPVPTLVEIISAIP